MLASGAADGAEVVRLDSGAGGADEALLTAWRKLTKYSWRDTAARMPGSIEVIPILPRCHAIATIIEASKYALHKADLASFSLNSCAEILKQDGS